MAKGRKNVAPKALSLPFSMMKTKMAHSRIVKKITAKTVLRTISPLERPICSGSAASTAAARPLGIRAVMSMASRRVTERGASNRTMIDRPPIAITATIKPTANVRGSSNVIEIPRKTKKNVFTRKTASAKNVRSTSENPANRNVMNFPRMRCGMLGKFATPMPNERAAMAPLYPQISVSPNRIKT